jgi:hypothetical protein
MPFDREKEQGSFAALPVQAAVSFCIICARRELVPPHTFGRFTLSQAA